VGPATSFFEQVIRKPADHLFSLIPMNLIIEPVPGSLAGCGCLPRVVPVAIVVEPLRGFWSNLSDSVTIRLICGLFTPWMDKSILVPLGRWTIAPIETAAENESGIIGLMDKRSDS